MMIKFGFKKRCVMYKKCCKVLRTCYNNSIDKKGGELIKMKFTIKQARKYAGLSQAEMAKRLGISLLTYRRYENGDSLMRIDKAAQFSNIVGIPFDSITFLKFD